nr:cullin, conserved site-containing protein [Tanacetum cinerariifolium]
MSKDCGTMKDLSVVCFLKEYASSQTAMTAFKKVEESKDYVDHLKISGFDYECNDAYFDSALKFLHADSLLEAHYNNFSKSKGMVDPLSVYSTVAKLSKIGAEEYEKQKEMAAAALAYKCIEVAYMRTGDISLAMEASLNTQNAYKATSTTVEESQNKEMTVSVKRVVDFSFQYVKELVNLMENARLAIHHQGFKVNNTQQSCK